MPQVMSFGARRTGDEPSAVTGIVTPVILRGAVSPDGVASLRFSRGSDPQLRDVPSFRKRESQKRLGTSPRHPFRHSIWFLVLLLSEGLFFPELLAATPSGMVSPKNASNSSFGARRKGGVPKFWGFVFRVSCFEFEIFMGNPP